jgi:hypothetical protein
VDTGDADAYASLFIEEGEVENSGGTVKGREAIRTWVAGLAKEGRIGPESRLKHVLGLPVIRGDGQRCTARTYVVIPKLMEAGDISTRFVGTYKDDIVKQDGRWQFAKRVIDLEFIARA